MKWEKIPNIREIAECTHRNLLSSRQHRWQFRDGVVDEVVRRAEGLSDPKAVVDAVEAAFLAYRISSINPRWDGSIA